MLYLGLDVGTQSVRAALFDAAGACRGFATAPLDTHHPRPGWAEQEPAQWWSSACMAVPAALAAAAAQPGDVAALGLDATACTVLPCRRDGTPLRNCLLWMDQRAADEAAEISATGHPCLRYVAGVVSPEWMLPKALWLKRHEPDFYGRAERLVECTDWFMHRLTGEWSLSLNHVTVKWNYARPDGGWDPAFLRQIGLDDIAAKWPDRIVPLGGGDAVLSSSAAAELGLRPGTPVAHGGIDAYLGMLGLGATRPGDLAMIVGSSTCHLAMCPTPLLGSGMLGCFPDAVLPGVSTLEGGQTATGSILNWFRQHFAPGQTFEQLDALAAAVPPGCDGLVCQDHFQGARSPLKDPRSRGAFAGLTLAHGPGHLFRSIYEGTAFGTRQILDDLASHGFMVERVFAGGGGAKSRLWMQIHADVLGRPIALPAESEACALGSALAAAVRVGRFADFAEAATAMVRMAEVVEPRTTYDNAYERYRRLYGALKDT